MKRHQGFTLIELLVVVAIMAMLIAILVPSLGKARAKAQATRCLANLRGIGQALVAYETTNDGYVVPSYNMPRAGTSVVSAGEILEGWAVILERDGFVPASRAPRSNVFYCPNTLDLNGMLEGQTGYDQSKPSGYQDWPIQFVTTGGDSAVKTIATVPIPGFGNSSGLYEKQIRCGYYLNALNPIGSAPAVGASMSACPNYTQCVGYGPYANGNLSLVRTQGIRRPSALIVACDGMYLGRQQVPRLGEQNRRVGYRHPGASVTVSVNGEMATFTNTLSNAVFADGHAEPIHNNSFPHGNVPAENEGPYSLLR